MHGELGSLLSSLDVPFAGEARRRLDQVTVKVVMQLVLVYTEAIELVEFHNLHASMSTICLARTAHTYPSRFRDLDYCHAISIRPLHLDIELFVTDDQNHVD